ncbi:MAG: helix-turn-helix transcriptional regulator [Lachnospiraceae bacterium]|nr:helix-turn-helix transcriptional regulator [Lachnospiraceae bacterium]
MKDKDLRKLIGSRARERRMELNLNQQYIAEKLDVNKSTIQRYESGTIDNTKKLVLEGLAEVLHVSVEWLKGETDEYETKITDKRDLQIRDLMSQILEVKTDGLDKSQAAFLKDILILIMGEYTLFADSFVRGCTGFRIGQDNQKVAKAMGFETVEEYDEIMFLREITRSINAYNDISEVLRLYTKDAKKASNRLRALLADFRDEE